MIGRSLPPFLINLLDGLCQLPKNFKTLPPRIAKATVSFLKNLGDGGVLIAWIAGFCLAGCLLFGLTWRPRMNFLGRNINEKLRTRNVSARVESPISPWLRNGASAQGGDWFSCSEGCYALVFSIPLEGVLTPFCALLSPDCKMLDLFPLSEHGAAVSGGIHRGVIDSYVEKIEKAASVFTGTSGGDVAPDADAPADGS